MNILLDRITQFLARTFALTPEDEERRNMDTWIRTISKRHPTATEATAEWLLLRNMHCPNETLRQTLDRNGVRVGKYWVGIQGMVERQDELVFLDNHTDEPFCVYSSKWLSEGPWQDELPALLEKEAQAVQHMPDQWGRLKLRQQREAADLAARFHTL